MSEISNENSKLWNQSFWSKNEPPTYTSKDNFKEPFNLSVLPIPKLKNPNIHYICPKCFNFPFIQFLNNKEDIYYSCACIRNKYLKIKDLFDPENKYITNLNNSNIINKKDDDNLNKNHGFKCTRHKSNESKKFKYFCIECNNNICEDCLKYHLNKKHDLMNLEIEMFEMNKKIEKINELLNKEEENTTDQSEETEKKDIEDFLNEDDKINNSINDNNKTIKLVKLDNGNYEKIFVENKKVILDNFKELIYIIINDYMNYPNYYHFFNIQNIYDILLGKTICKNEETTFPEYNNNEEGIVVIESFGIIKYIKCNIKEKMGDICKNANINIYNYEIFYNENKINLDSSFEEIINKEDKKANIMKIKLNYKIYNIDEDRDKEKDKINNIKSKDIICPLCGESIFMNIKDYKINLYDCKNKHRINNLLLSEFEKTQNIDLSKIICNICNDKTRDKAHNNLFFRCLSCGKNLCS